MIEWLGPIVYEYYAGSEGQRSDCSRHASMAQSSRHGRPSRFGKVHIVGEDGDELPAGEVGTIYFSGGGRYVYF